MFSLADLDEVVNRCFKVELASFHALGSRPIGEDAASALFIAGASRAHGFRAGVLETCVPVASGYAGAQLRALPGGVTAVLEALRDGGDDRDVVDALVGVFYPALRDGYERLRMAADGPGDTSVHRAFRRCRDDVAGVLDEARALGVTTADGLCARLVRARLEEAGGPSGFLDARPRREAAGSPGRAPGRTA